jgi:hypothetical protein
MWLLHFTSLWRNTFPCKAYCESVL